MTTLDLAALKALREAGTKGEWRDIEELEAALKRFDPQVIGYGPSTDMRMLSDAQGAARAVLEGE